MTDWDAILDVLEEYDTTVEMIINASADVYLGWNADE